MAYNKSDLVSKIAQKSNLTKAQAEAAVNAFQDVFVEAMQSGDLRRSHLRRLPAEEGCHQVSHVLICCLHDESPDHDGRGFRRS